MNKTSFIVKSALLAALTCAATIVIKIPSMLGGYINAGDCVVLLSGWLLGPTYGFFAAAVGSALADVISGYFVYVPATFLIKGLMALCAYYIFNRKNNIYFLLFSAFCAEVLMILLYYIFEGFLYGFVPSLVNVPANAIQGVAGVLMGVLLYNMFSKKSALK